MKRIYTAFLALLGCNTYAQVHLQTGAAQFNLPVFSYSDKDGLSAFGAVNYVNGNGLKVNEIASSIGAGWRPEYGGQIDRIQNGEPDDQQRPSNVTWTLSNSFYFGESNYYPNGFLYSSYSTSTDADSRAAYFPIVPSPWMRYNPHEKFTDDREQDYFNFNFNGRTGTFVIGKNGGIRILEDSRLKVTKVDLDMHSSNIRTTISSFTITDENGIQYVFKDKILAEVCKYDNSSYPNASGIVNQDDGLSQNQFYCNFSQQCNNYSGFDYKVYQARRLNQYIVNSWYLSEIVNPRTTKNIQFKYDNYDIDFRSGAQLQSSQMAGQNSIALILTRYLLKAKRIREIIFPNTHSIYFNYSSQDRIDFPDKALLDIHYKIDGAIKYSHHFDYGYMFKHELKSFDYSFSNSEKIYSRLCLKSIQRIGSDGTTENPYLFDYNIIRDAPYDQLDVSIPPRLTLWQDRFGYFKLSVGSLPDCVFDPNQSSFTVPDAYSLNYILTGYSSANTRAVSDAVAKYGIVKQITYPLGGALTFEYEQRDARYNNQNVSIGGVRVKKTVLYDGIDHAKDIVNSYEYTNGSSVSSGWGFEEAIYSRTGDYVRMYKSTDKYPALFSSGVALALSYKNVAKTFFMTSPTQLSASVALLIVNFIIALVDYFSPDYQDYSQTIFSYQPYNSNTLALQYSKVTVTQLLQTGNNGKIVYEYTDPSYRAIDEPTLNAPFSYKQRMAEFAYGLPLKESIFQYKNSAFQIIKEKIFNYQDHISYMTDANYLSKKWEVIMPIYIPKSTYESWVSSSTSSTYNLRIDSYYPLVGRTDLTQIKERLYNSAGNYSETVKQFQYNSDNFKINSIISTDSEGDQTETKVFFTEDYANAGIFQTLRTHNIISIPISTETWITKGTNAAKLINATAVEFAVINNNDIKAIRDYKLESAMLLLQSQIQAFNPNSSVRDVNLIIQRSENTYDNSGNIIQIKSVAEKSSSMLDYHESQNTMTILNASPGEYAYTSFEAENPGFWNFSNTNIVQQASVTGIKSYALGTITSDILVTKPSVLSLWATNSNFTVNASFSPIKTVNVIPGWTYYEFDVSSSINNAVTITGSAMVDEVRLYPKDALMKTFTHDPLMGKTSMCDESNHILYYEYDGLGRLVIVRDEKRNILKTYEYHTKQN